MYFIFICYAIFTIYNMYILGASLFLSNKIKYIICGYTKQNIPKFYLSFFTLTFIANFSIIRSD